MPRRRALSHLLARSLASGAGVVLVACQLALDFGGGDGQADASVTPEGSVLIEAAADDVPPTRDVEAEAPPISYGPCDAAFCDDFNRDVIGPAWGVNQNFGNTVALDSTVSLSPPRSLLVDLPLDNYAPAFLSKRFIDEPRPRVIVEVAIRFDALDQIVDLAQLRLAPAPAGFESLSVNLYVSGGSPGIEACVRRVGDPDRTCQTAGLGVPGDAAFHQYRVTADFMAGRIVGSMDGVESGEITVPAAVPQGYELALGLPYVNVTQPVRLHFDDFVIRFQ